MINKIQNPVFLGFFYGFISFLITFFLFAKLPKLIGITTILFVVIFLVPRVNSLLEEEEKKHDEKTAFFTRHKEIISFYLFFFVGLLMIFFLISLLFPELIFSRSQLLGLDVKYEKRAILLPPIASLTNEMWEIFLNNLFVITLSFLLSIFAAGVGGLFLITLNASIFANVIADIVTLKTPAALGFILKYGVVSCNFGLTLLYAIPETSAYLIAAIAGGVLEKAFVHEKIFSREFLDSVKESAKFVLFAVAIIIVSAVAEVGITRKIVFKKWCAANPYVAAVITLVLLFAILVIVIYRDVLKSEKIETVKKTKR